MGHGTYRRITFVLREKKSQPKSKVMVFVDGLARIAIVLKLFMLLLCVFACFERLRVESRAFHSVDSTLRSCYKPLRRGFFFMASWLHLDLVFKPWEM